jgi:hypothetical protein
MGTRMGLRDTAVKSDMWGPIKKLTWQQLSESLHRRFLMAEWQIREALKKYGG